MPADYASLTPNMWTWLLCISVLQKWINHYSHQIKIFDDPKALPDHYHWQPQHSRDHYAQKTEDAIVSHDRAVADYEAFFGPMPDLKEALQWRKNQHGENAG